MMEQNTLTELSDEALTELARRGDARAQDVLLERYKSFVKRHARAYFLAGADMEDVIQEGMIGLYKAIRDYDAGKNGRFDIFARLCVTRQIITAIKSASRKKHAPLNTYIPLNRSDDSRPMDDAAAFIGAQPNPEELFIDEEGRLFIETCIQEELSAMESRVLSLYIAGNTYGEIGRAMNKEAKSIDNALQRVRKKLERILVPHP